MYEKFFALEKSPFSVVPDPDFIHLTGQHADAISGLAFGVLERKGYLTLTGEAGLGKTTILRALSGLLAESKIESSVIFAPTLTASEFLELVMLNFGFKDVPTSKAQRLKMLEEFLVRSDAEGTVLALIVDEAHQLSPELLEEVRLLGNFETTSRKLLQIVLVGQNELNDRLNLPQLWQLKQRITLRLSLQRLNRDAVGEYLRFRWGRAGGAEPLPFGGPAIDAIAKWSLGIPRLINVICENALLIAFSQGRRQIDAAIIQAACQELSLQPPTPEQGRTPASPPPRPLQPAPKPIVTQPNVQPQIQPRQPEAEANGWAASRPSLLKRWLSFTSPRPQQPSKSRSGFLSLDDG